MAPQVKSSRARSTPVKGATTAIEETTQNESGTPPKSENCRKRAAAEPASTSDEPVKAAKRASIFDLLKAPKPASTLTTQTKPVLGALPEPPATAVLASVAPEPAATAPPAAPTSATVSAPAKKRTGRRTSKLFAATSATLTTIATTLRSATPEILASLPAPAPHASAAPAVPFASAEKPTSEEVVEARPTSNRASHGATKPATTCVPESEPAPASESSSPSEPSFSSELKLGSASYTCLCTRDAEAAGTWAELVTQDVDAKAELGPVVAVLGVDCEWAAVWHRAAGTPDRLATLQLFHHGSSGRRALVFSVAALGGELPTALLAVLKDSRIAKVGVNIAGDASRMVRDFGCSVLGLYDLSNLNKVQGQKLRKAVSLEDLVQSHCPEDMHISKGHTAMTKGVRTSNWEAWPLSAEQIEYAAKDAGLGVMAFIHRFGMDDSNHQLSKEAVDSLVNLEEANKDSITKTKAVEATSKRKAVEAASEADTATADSSDQKQKKKKAASKSEDVEATCEAESTQAAPKKDHKHFFMAMRNSILKPPNVGKKDHPQGAKDALKGVCIIVSGILDSFERADMEKYVKEHGGSVSKTVTKNVTHLVTDHGEAGPSKLAKCKELNIPSVSEDVILQLVSKSLTPQ